MKTLIAATLVAGSVLAAPIFANAQTSTDIYGSLNYSQTRTKGADTGAIQGRVGAKLTPYFGVEGEIAGGVDSDKVGASGGQARVKMEHQVAGYAVGYLPVTPKLDLTGRVGYGTTKFSTNNVAATQFDGSRDSWNYGLGAEYKLDGKNGVRADWTKSEYTNSDLSSNTVSVGYVRHF
ncbi:porin family protein [Caulobacter sp. SL161]|uniref:porin family protein n=1 Tax=Caulobacter sp. SL161 TaxID=2995156 RepID=UPI002272FEFB|nr:porin family protein [Caulobacter sp. SL161]MCY1647438.1 porin family protein [Caulobacter sp. SL161]